MYVTFVVAMCLAKSCIICSYVVNIVYFVLSGYSSANVQYVRPKADVSGM